MPKVPGHTPRTLYKPGNCKSFDTACTASVLVKFELKFIKQSASHFFIPRVQFVPGVVHTYIFRSTVAVYLTQFIVSNMKK